MCPRLVQNIVLTGKVEELCLNLLLRLVLLFSFLAVDHRVGCLVGLPWKPTKKDRVSIRAESFIKVSN